MKNTHIHSSQELQTLARQIEASSASWRGVAYYSMRPMKGRGTVDIAAITSAASDTPLCIKSNSGNLIYLGKPIANSEALQLDICGFLWGDG